MDQGPVQRAAGGDIGPAEGPVCGATLYTAVTDVSRIQAAQRTSWLVREVVAFAEASPALLQRLSIQPIILFRHVTSPNFEFFRLLDLAMQLARPPLFLEIPRDWFTPAVNPSKRRLGKLPIYQGDDSKGVARVRHVAVVSFSEPRQRFSELVCRDGTSFVGFHHELVAKLGSRDLTRCIFDASALAGKDGPTGFYERLFALLTCFGVVADNFPLTGPDQAFTTQIVMPAFEATVRRFGARPMIVRLLPEASETDEHWEWYPLETLPHAKRAAAR